jgi:hypothetical protein
VEEFAGLVAVSSFGINVSETFRFVYYVSFSTNPNLCAKFALPPTDKNFIILRYGN